jgi:dephospho-CoA kinase
MKIVGLTGGIGSGKTTVAAMFKKLGVPVYIADEQAKHLSNTNPEIRREVIQLLGEQAYLGKTLNRAYVAKIVFNDAEKLASLNAIIHPRVRNHFQQWRKTQQGSYCIKEAAILFENGNYKNCDATILVIAPKKVRIDRVMARDSTTEAEVKKRMEHQWPERRKKLLATYIIENIDIEKTARRVKMLHEKLLQKYRKA